jgi:Tfp pilus assembly protein PilN
MRVQLNLATNPLKTHRRFFAGATLVGMLAGLVLLVLSWHVYNVRRAEMKLREQVAQYQEEMVRLRQERRGMEEFFARPENTGLHGRAAFLNTLIDQRSFNWTQMFIDLEKLLPPGVRVVSIAPKLEQGGVSVKLTIGTNSEEGKLRFLRALESSKVFSGIEVLTERPPSPGEVSDQTVVELRAWYLRG